MRRELIETLKMDLEKNLKSYLREEGIELYVATNDNTPTSADMPLVMLESIESLPLEGNKLLTRIRMMLGILGKEWDSNTLVDGIYQALQPHNITMSELTVLLMSLHVEMAHCVRPRKALKKAVISYIIEESQ